MASAGSILKGCGIGCGVAVLLTVLTVVGCGVSLVAPFKSAEKTREKLEETHGSRADYRPAVDGAIAADRLRIFLTIRETLMEHCAGFDDTFAQFERMDELEEDEASKSQMFGEVFSTVTKALGLPARMGKYATARNDALLEHGMGLGEYTYIFVLTYYSWLGKDVAPEAMEFDEERAPTHVRDALRGMLRSQLEDLRAADPSSPLQADLCTEIEAMIDDEDRLPWRDGLPPAIVAGLEPQRSRIEAAWCDGTSPFELIIHRTENKGFTIRAD